MQSDMYRAHAMGIKLDEPIPEPQARHPSQADLWRETAYAWKAQSDTWELRCLDAQASAEKAVAFARKANASQDAAWHYAVVMGLGGLAAMIWAATR